jgi:hypothetical protein
LEDKKSILEIRKMILDTRKVIGVQVRALLLSLCTSMCLLVLGFMEISSLDKLPSLLPTLVLHRTTPRSTLR